MKDNTNLTFEKLKTINRQRCENAFHPIDHWTPSDWGCAMAGECGEACNNIKKLRRLEGSQYSRENEQDADKLVDAVMDEIADMVIYADLLATRLNRNLADAVMNKFNRTSKQIGSTIKL